MARQGFFSEFRSIQSATASEDTSHRGLCPVVIGVVSVEAGCLFYSERGTAPVTLPDFREPVRSSHRTGNKIDSLH